MLRDTHGNWNIRSAGFLQKTAQQASPELRVAPRARNSQDLELRTVQREPHSEGVINIAADVGVDDDFFRRVGSRRRFLCLSGHGRTQQETKRERSASQAHVSSSTPLTPLLPYALDRSPHWYTRPPLHPNWQSLYSRSASVR